MEQNLIDEIEDDFKSSEVVDIYEKDYVQELLDDDALDGSEAAFLQGYVDWPADVS